MLGRRGLIGTALAGAGLARAARAGVARDLLRVTWRDPPGTLDFYHDPLRTGFILSLHLWDALVYRDPETFQIKPLLATSWRQTNDTTIEFTLRERVAFHNGDPFGADDVVYTVERVLADQTLAVPSNYDFLAGVEKIDNMHVRIRLKRVFPAALEYIAMVLPIWPRDAREAVGGESFARAPIGTGPYRLARPPEAGVTEIVRNESYFDGPKGHPAIPRIVVTQVETSEQEVAALVQGSADWIWDFGADQFDQITRQQSLIAVRAETMRVAYLSLDAAGRSGTANPLTNEKVRQAIAHAIDRTALARQVAQGGSRPLDAPCYPSQFGCDQAMAVRYPYDPARARALLAEAGYPEGFHTAMVSYLVPRWTDAVRDALAAVGIVAETELMPTAPAMRRAARGDAPLFLGSWGSYAINDVSAFLPVFFAGGPNDYVRDPDLAALVDRGDTTTDPDQRRKLYGEAIRLITSHADWLPLFTVSRSYGFSRQLLFRPFPDELPRFYLASWKS